MVWNPDDLDWTLQVSVWDGHQTRGDTCASASVKVERPAAQTGVVILKRAPAASKSSHSERLIEDLRVNTSPTPIVSTQ
jgi:hypothetical protein